MISLGIAAVEPGLTTGERRWRRETRSSVLRLAVLAILIVNLLAGEHGGNLLVHSNVLLGYSLSTVLALGLAIGRRGPAWSGTFFVVIDALAVVALFHEHLYGPSGTLDHSLTTTSLAIAFLLLTHVALRLRPQLVLLFATIVVAGWLSLLVFRVLQHTAPGGATEPLSILITDATLAAAFGFAAFVAYLLTLDHNVLLKGALKSERRRHSLSRFFSPAVVTELQRGAASLALERRDAAVMFVDLRGFSRFSETAQPGELAELLAEYRQQVAQAVFDRGGTVDKFIGDGVMAVFGQPQPRADDAERALHCALEVNALLARWQESRQRQGKAALHAGIGLHVGPVIGGVLESGLHDEFTVLGDAVNVAERLERLTKALHATLVVSTSVLERVPSGDSLAPWQWKDDVELEGRRGTIGIAYLVRPATLDEPPEEGLRVS